eukprot:2114164-Alexandrium_andersonii.AAC.1
MLGTRAAVHSEPARSAQASCSPSTRAPNTRSLGCMLRTCVLRACREHSQAAPRAPLACRALGAAHAHAWAAS